MFDVPPTFAAAFAPALVLLAVLAWTGRSSGAGPGSCAASFSAGALLAAPLSAGCNRWLQDVAGVPPAVVASAAAPLVEEIAKAAVLWCVLHVLSRTSPRPSVRTWIVCGLGVGLGFTATENTQYLLLSSLQGGPPGLWRGIFVRGLAWGMHHAVFAALGAVALWHAGRPSPDRARASRWALGAVGLHVAWNSIGAAGIVAMVCDAPSPGSSCRWPPGAFDLFVSTPLLSLAALSPGLVALRVAWRSGELDGRGFTEPAAPS